MRIKGGDVMPLQSVIMYLVQSEAEIPQQVLPNTSYYIIGREVRIYDNAGQLSVFTLKKHPSLYRALLYLFRVYIIEVKNRIFKEFI